MDSGILLDTCAVLWVFGGDDVLPDARRAIEEAAQENRLFISPISAWEIGMLVAKGRIALSIPVREWIEQVFAHASVMDAGLTVSVLTASSFLPGRIHGDPADRIIVATARARGLSVATRDRLILDYARQGHVKAVSC